MLDLDLNDPTNQVRAIVGDVDGSFISDNNIKFLLIKHSDNVKRASSEALDYILNLVAYYVREEAGDVEIYWNDIYNNLFKRKQNLDKDLLYSYTSTLFKFGGTSATEVKRVNRDVESDGIGIRLSDFNNQLVSLGIDPENPYILIRE